METKNSDSNAELFGHLFMHLKQHGDMMMLIQMRGLFHLFKESYLTLGDLLKQWII